MAALFQLGNFTLHSGARSCWKIDCDALTPEDWAALAAMAVEILPSFHRVTGVRRGGWPFAQALRHYQSGRVEDGHLIVDDVWTTGDSVRKLCPQGLSPSKRACVVFARGPVDEWVTALFQMPGDGV